MPAMVVGFNPDVEYARSVKRAVLRYLARSRGRNWTVVWATAQQHPGSN